MTVPTFLGIGVSRSGTTWLHQLLLSHPDVYVPRRKEIYYFNEYYERGLRWYEGFFPPEAQAGRYRAVGEITPTYWYSSECPERISRMPSITKLIMIVRNPVDRAYSDYGLRLKNGLYSGSFEDFLSFRPQALEWGYYSPKLGNYLHYFRRDQILVLIFEHTMADIPCARETLARFLGIRASQFPPGAGVDGVNRGYVPRARSAYALAASVAKRLRYEWDMDWLVNLAKKVGVERMFGETGRLPPMKEETRRYLRELYGDEIRQLESLLGIDLDCWRV